MECVQTNFHVVPMLEFHFFTICFDLIEIMVRSIPLCSARISSILLGSLPFWYIPFQALFLYFLLVKRFISFCYNFSLLPGTSFGFIFFNLFDFFFQLWHRFSWIWCPTSKFLSYFSSVGPAPDNVFQCVHSIQIHLSALFKSSFTLQSIWHTLPLLFHFVKKWCRSLL